MKETVIFLHIAKAGGTTFEHILERYYRPEVTYALDNWDTLAAIERLRTTPKEQLSHIHLLKGHMPFGLHEHLPGQARYITFLRDPVERLISMYYFVLRTPEHYLHQVVTSQNMDLQTFVKSPISPELDNGQVKALSGNFTHYGCATCDDLEAAKRNLREWFEVVGITERYDESLLLMKQALRWSGWPLYKSANVTGDRPKAESLAPDAIAAVRQVNSLDVELYEWALARLQDAVATTGPLFRAKLWAFRRSNKHYNAG